MFNACCLHDIVHTVESKPKAQPCHANSLPCCVKARRLIGLTACVLTSGTAALCTIVEKCKHLALLWPMMSAAIGMVMDEW